MSNDERIPQNRELSEHSLAEQGNTGGDGAHFDQSGQQVGNQLNVGGDVKGDVAGRDIIYGDKVEGDKITTIIYQIVQRISGRDRWAGLILLLAILIGVTWILTEVRRQAVEVEDAGAFRIAIAEFDTQHIEGKQIGLAVADSIFKQLQASLNELDPNFHVAIIGPEKVGGLPGNDAEERAQSATNVAEKLGAQIVVYGVIDGDDDVWSVQPEFYVAADYFFDDAYEFIGVHDLGSPFPVVGTGDVRAQITVRDAIAIRMKLLAHVVIGLTYYAAPSERGTNYKRALEFFEAIQENENLWEEIDSKHLVNLLIGNTKGKLGDLTGAVDAFTAALDHDPEYSRAYAGLGSVYYVAALITDTIDGVYSIDTTLLAKAISEYELALDADNQPPKADIEVKVHFGLGQSYVMLGFYKDNGVIDESLLDKAIEEFSAVIYIYNETGNLRIKHLAAESYARIGLIQRSRGRTMEARDAYEQAAKLAVGDPGRREIFKQALTELSDDPNAQSQWR